VEKLIWLAWRPADLDGSTVGERLEACVRGVVAADGVAGVTVCVEAREADGMRWGEDPRGLVLSGYVSVWLDRVEQRDAVDDALTTGFAATGVRTASYVVVESAPLEYGAGRTWPDGERSPGVSAVTAFERAPGVDGDDFFRRWHGSHTPLTFELHPVAQYLRHAVLRCLTAEAPAFAGIVLESFATLSDLTDPMRFFGARTRDELTANIQRVEDDVARIAHRATLQTTPMYETILRSPPWWRRG
jgi:hypothetical protein